MVSRTLVGIAHSMLPRRFTCSEKLHRLWMCQPASPPTADEIDVCPVRDWELSEARHALDPHPISALPVNLVGLRRDKQARCAINRRRKLKRAHDLFDKLERNGG